MQSFLAAAAALSLLVCAESLLTAQEPDDWEARRQAALERPRRVLYNTDGCDALYYPKDRPVTEEDFQSLRFSYSEGTEVDTLLYCPVSGGFGHLLYDSKVAETLDRDPEDATCINVTSKLIAMGTNPVQQAEKYCRRRGLEFFVSMRFNDTHDAAVQKSGQRYFLLSRWKEQHPELLFSPKPEKRPPYCSWSAVDLGEPAVQDFICAQVAEICERFDLDGIEYDFMRHAQLFRSVGWGGTASEEELEKATALLTRLRSITEEAGKRRGRPILVAVRIPDSKEYCKAIGIDMEHWLSRRLIDILITTSYFRFNRWSYSAALAHRYGAKFYASLDESRINGSLPIGKRNSRPAYWARIMTAQFDGADGVYLFNAEYGGLHGIAYSSDEHVRFQDKLYYATERGSGGYTPQHYLKDGDCFYNLPRIEPGHPAVLSGGKTRLDFDIVIADDLTSAEAQARRPVVTAQLRTPAVEARLMLEVNGRSFPATGHDSDVFTFALPADALCRGNNHFAICCGNGMQEVQQQLMCGDKLLSGSAQSQWRRFFPQQEGAEAIEDGAYLLRDDTDDPANAMAFFHPLPALDGGYVKASFEMKYGSSDCDDGVVFRLANGRHLAKLCFQADRITMDYSGKSAEFRTDDAFHAYELTLENGEALLTADGKELLRAAAVDVFDAAHDICGNSEVIADLNTCGLILGSIACEGKGTSSWRNICVSQRNLQIRDFAVGIAYRHLPSPALQAAGKAPILPLAACRPDALGMECTGAVKSNYPSEAVTMQEDGTAILTHVHGKGTDFYMNFSETLCGEEQPEILLAEWSVQPVENGGKDEPCFLAAVAPRRPGKEGKDCWEVQTLIGTDGITSTLGAITPSDVDARALNTYRLAIDTRTGEGALWCNGKLLTSGIIAQGEKRGNAFCYIGDGSGRVEGRCRLGAVTIGYPAAQ